LQPICNPNSSVICEIDHTTQRKMHESLQDFEKLQALPYMYYNKTQYKTNVNKQKL
jgi:hypothetical protein